MSLTLKEARQAHVRYVNKYGRAPEPDELVAFVAIEEKEFETRQRLQLEEERSKFVQVQFHGHGRIYCYELKPVSYGRVSIGDYVAVYSPLSDQTELVRVIDLGRGTWNGGAKFCRPIKWETVGD